MSDEYKAFLKSQRQRKHELEGRLGIAKRDILFLEQELGIKKLFYDCWKEGHFDAQKDKQWQVEFKLLNRQLDREKQEVEDLQTQIATCLNEKEEDLMALHPSLF